MPPTREQFFTTILSGTAVSSPALQVSRQAGVGFTSPGSVAGGIRVDVAPAVGGPWARVWDSNRQGDFLVTSEAAAARLVAAVITVPFPFEFVRFNTEANQTDVRTFTLYGLVR